jgi:hypothetical protein
MVMRATLGYDRSYTEEQTGMSVDQFLSLNYYNGDMDAEEVVTGLMDVLDNSKDRENLWAMYMRGEDLEEVVGAARFMR